MYKKSQWQISYNSNSTLQRLSKANAWKDVSDNRRLKQVKTQRTMFNLIVELECFIYFLFRIFRAGSKNYNSMAYGVF